MDTPASLAAEDLQLKDKFDATRSSATIFKGVPTTATIDLESMGGDGNVPDVWLETIRKCQPLPEQVMKRLCDMVLVAF